MASLLVVVSEDELQLVASKVARLAIAAMPHPLGPDRKTGMFPVIWHTHDPATVKFYQEDPSDRDERDAGYDASHLGRAQSTLTGKLILNLLHLAPYIDAIRDRIHRCYRGHVRIQAGPCYPADLFHRTPVLAILTASSFPPDGIEPARLRCHPTFSFTERVGETGHPGHRVGASVETETGTWVGGGSKSDDEYLAFHPKRSWCEVTEGEYKDLVIPLSFS